MARDKTALKGLIDKFQATVKLKYGMPVPLSTLRDFVQKYFDRAIEAEAFSAFGNISKDDYKPLLEVIEDEQNRERKPGRTGRVQ